MFEVTAMDCRRRFCGLALLGLLAAAMATDLRADEKSAEELLSAQGLVRRGNYFVLGEESEWAGKVQKAVKLKKTVLDTQREFKNAEAEVAKKNAAIREATTKRLAVEAQLAQARSADQHNQLVLLMNQLTDYLNLNIKSDAEEKRVEAARSAAGKVREDYAHRLLGLRQQYQKIQARYEQLAANAEVGKAIDEYNEAAAKHCKLGPSPTVLINDRALKKLEDVVISEAIPIRRSAGDNWHVFVSLGSKSQEMMIDTGCSSVALPYKIAEACGLAPKADSPDIRCQLADGKLVTAKLVIAPRVAVGKFSAENVECTVMPADLVEATPLLGMSFFKHFSFQIDQGASKLLMSTVEDTEKPARTPARNSVRRGKRQASGG
jgi:clan AA aspartic protease (TIGR02281 family)